MHNVKFKIVGEKRLLVHGDRFADPLDPATKEHKALTSKRKKTDDDFEAIAKSEWKGGLYFDRETGPYIPSANLEAMIFEGAKSEKQGKTVKSTIEVVEERAPILYDGPRDIEGLWQKGFYDSRSVKVGQSRVRRYRPCFREWALEFTVAFDPEAIDRDDLVRFVKFAGERVGIGDYRPKCGKFRVEEAA